MDDVGRAGVLAEVVLPPRALAGPAGALRAPASGGGTTAGCC